MNITSRLILAIARLEPSGLIPFAPGTWGSLFSLIIAYFCFLPLPFFARIISLIALFFFGIFACTHAEKLLNAKDPSSIVIDELVGLWIVLLPLQALNFNDLKDTNTLLQLFLAFALFRFFDITKIFPIKQLEKSFSGGFGIMLDDVVAGFFALACFLIIKHYVF